MKKASPTRRCERSANNGVGDIGMIRSLIARMGTDLEAGSLLCHNACRAEDDHLPEVFEKTLMAKYFTSRAAVRAASDAVQIRGPRAATDHRRFRGITGMPRSWRSSKAPPRFMRTFWGRCLSTKPAGSASDTDTVDCFYDHLLCTSRTGSRSREDRAIQLARRRHFPTTSLYRN